MNQRHSRYRRQAGFTLVELLLVILILSSLALVTTFMVDNMNEQFRFDQTKSRLEQIRRAVIGDVSRSINGEPEISGFVADMGRLPANLRELVELGEQTAWHEGALNIPGGPLSSVNLEIRLPGGWRGPYLETLPESTGDRAFRDGWGNVGDSDDEDNFGWVFESLSGVMFVQSRGMDGALSAVDAENEYQHDYPPTGRNLVEEDDYTLKLGLLTVEFSKAPSQAGQSLYVSLFRMMDGESLDGALLESDPFPTLSGVRTYQAAFPAERLPLGQYAAVVSCDVDGSVFDGRCSDGNGLNTHPFYFKVAPRRQLPTIQWNTHQ